MDVEVLLFEGVDELDAIESYETFRLASDPIDARLVTPDPTNIVEARNGLRVEPDDTLLASSDAFFIPGGGWNDPGPGVKYEYEHGEILGLTRTVSSSVW